METLACERVRAQTTAFVDDELDGVARRDVEIHLAACAACRDLVARESAGRAVLLAHRAELRARAPERLRHAIDALGRSGPSRSRPRPLSWLAPLPMAATLLLAVGGVVGYGLLGRGGAALAGQLSLDHAKCIRIVGDRHAAGDPQAMGAAWHERHGWPIRVPAPGPGERFTFLTLRHCLHSHGLMAHALYRRDDHLISLFVLPHAVPTTAELEIMGERASIWTANGRTYAVVGASTPAEYDEFVAMVQRSAR